MFEKVRNYLLGLEYDYIIVRTYGILYDTEEFIYKTSNKEIFDCIYEEEVEQCHIDEVTDMIVGLFEEYGEDFKILFILDNEVIFDNKINFRG